MIFFAEYFESRHIDNNKTPTRTNEMSRIYKLVVKKSAIGFRVFFVKILPKKLGFVGVVSGGIEW